MGDSLLEEITSLQSHTVLKVLPSLPPLKTVLGNILHLWKLKFSHTVARLGNSATKEMTSQTSKTNVIIYQPLTSNKWDHIQNGRGMAHTDLQNIMDQLKTDSYSKNIIESPVEYCSTSKRKLSNMELKAWFITPEEWKERVFQTAAGTQSQRSGLIWEEWDTLLFLSASHESLRERLYD